MNTLYVASTGRVMLDENNNIVPLNSTRNAVSNVYLVKEDTKIVYKEGDKEDVAMAKAGDIIVTFYESDFPHRVISVNSDAWKENIEEYERSEQALKERWAAGKTESISKDCADCKNAA